MFVSLRPKLETVLAPVSYQSSRRRRQRKRLLLKVPNFTQWIHIAEWIAPFVKRIADWSVQRARTEVVRSGEKIQFDGFYLTHGH